MNMTTESFIQQLLRRSPELKSTYDAHVADNDGLLPHVFMGDVTRFTIRQTTQPESQEILMGLLEQIESGLVDGSDEVKELIAVSFVENLCGEEEALESLSPIMGFNLREEVRKLCG